MAQLMVQDHETAWRYYVGRCQVDEWVRLELAHYNTLAHYNAPNEEAFYEFAFGKYRHDRFKLEDVTDEEIEAIVDRYVHDVAFRRAFDLYYDDEGVRIIAEMLAEHIRTVRDKARVGAELLGRKSGEWCASSPG